MYPNPTTSRANLKLKRKRWSSSHTCPYCIVWIGDWLRPPSISCVEAKCLSCLIAITVSSLVCGCLSGGGVGSNDVILRERYHSDYLTIYCNNSIYLIVVLQWIYILLSLFLTYSLTRHGYANAHVHKC